MSDVRGMVRYLGMGKGPYETIHVKEYLETVDNFKARGLTTAEIEETISILINPNENRYERIGAIKLLGIHRFKGTSKFLIEALEDPNSAIANESAKVLGDMQDVSAIPALARALNRDLEVRCHAAESLEKLGDQRGLTTLIEIISFPDPGFFIESTIAKWSIGRIIEECETAEKLAMFEDRFMRGLRESKLRKSEISQEVNMKLAEIKNKIAARRNELAVNNGILLSDIPKPPKKGPMYQSIRKERVRNG